MPTMDLHADSRSIDDDDAFDPSGDDDAYPQTNRDADHHTIVDMNLRTVRFMVVVAVALVVAFAYAAFTIQPHTLARAATEAQAASSVEFYNVIFGPTMFATSKIFEIYTETLIFPTLHTYLHNCSLYPGDEPQRTTSKIKTRAIFWGLKTVVILMNVGTASLFISSREPHANTVKAVAQSVETHARRLQHELATPDLDGFAAFLHGAPVAPPFDVDTSATCGADATSQWTRADVDYTSVTFGVARRPWSEQIVENMETIGDDAPLVVRLEDCADGVQTACDRMLETRGFHTSDVARLLTHAAATLQTGWPASMSGHNATLRGSASQLRDVMNAHDVTLSVERVHSMGSTMASLVAVVSMTRKIQDEAITCGGRSCVVSVPVSPSQEMVIRRLDERTTEFLTTASSRRAVASTDGSVEELSSYSFAIHTLPASGLGLTIDKEGTQIVVSDLSALAPRPTRLATLHSVVLPDTTELTTWLPVENPVAGRSWCDPLVDAYTAQFQQAKALFDPSHTAHTMATATLLFLTQNATYVPSESAMLALARRLDESTTSTGKTIKLKLSITAYSAVATFAGCGVMVILMIFVVMRPQARVRLTPNTTAAAQYVQILTDDLYPNIVHKKRLRFVNGEALPFNEYVVDSIVLHAKRDTTKKIYL